MENARLSRKKCACCGDSLGSVYLESGKYRYCSTCARFVLNFSAALFKIFKDEDVRRESD